MCCNMRMCTQIAGIIHRTIALPPGLSKCINNESYDFLCPKTVLEADEVLQIGSSLEPRNSQKKSRGRFKESDLSKEEGS